MDTAVYNKNLIFFRHANKLLPKKYWEGLRISYFLQICSRVSLAPRKAPYLGLCIRP